MIPQYPSKEFGKLELKGGLNKFNQILKTKYLYPTKDFPTGKAVISICVPDHVNSFSVDRNELKAIVDINDKLGIMAANAKTEEEQRIFAQQMGFNSFLIRSAKAEMKPFVTKSFRFNETDFPQTHQFLSDIARLFGYLFCKYKTEIEKQGSTEHLMAASRAVAQGDAEKVYKEFMAGFMEAMQENIDMKIVARKE